MKKYLNMDELKKRTSLRLDSSVTQSSNVEEFENNIKCPKCKEQMSQVKHGELMMDKCEFCNGYWIKDGQLEYLCENLTDRQIDHLNTIGKVKQKRKSYSNLFHFDLKQTCPYCTSNLREIYFKLDHKIKLDVCDRCKGVFYDSEELKTVIRTIKKSNI